MSKNTSDSSQWYISEKVNSLHNKTHQEISDIKFISPKLYEEAFIGDFEDLDAVYLDHSAFIDTIRNEKAYGPLSDYHQFGAEKMLRLIDSVLALESQGKNNLTLKYPRDMENFGLMRKEDLMKEYELLRQIAEPFELYNDKKAQAFEHTPDDAAIARRMEIEDEKNIIVATDYDFANLENHFDIKAYPPDVAELGITTQI